MNSQPASRMACAALGCESITEALRLADARNPRLRSASIMRGSPQRRPYSAQLKFGTSGTVSLPCGGVSSVRGMGRSKGQCSTFTTMCARMWPPSSGINGGRSDES
ncbi:hypothetical protein D3C72_1133580 [compost metagenome]